MVPRLPGCATARGCGSQLNGRLVLKRVAGNRIRVTRFRTLFLPHSRDADRIRSAALVPLNGTAARRRQRQGRRLARLRRRIGLHDSECKESERRQNGDNDPQSIGRHRSAPLVMERSCPMPARSPLMQVNSLRVALGGILVQPASLGTSGSTSWRRGLRGRGSRAWGSARSCACSKRQVAYPRASISNRRNIGLLHAGSAQHWGTAMVPGTGATACCG